MKKLLLLLCIGLMAFNPCPSDCKPDIDPKDKFTNEQTVAWNCKLWDMGASAIVKTGIEYDVIMFYVQGKTLGIQINYHKSEANTTNQALITPYTIEKGKEMLFAFEGHEAIRLVIDDGVSKTKPGKISEETLQTTVSVSATPKGEDLAKLQEAFTNHRLTAFRVGFANNTLEHDVNEKYAKQVQEKAICYFQYLKSQNLMK